MIRTHSTHPDEEDDGPFKWISPGDTKVNAIILQNQWNMVIIEMYILILYSQSSSK
jgi:hypothetical protein